MINLQLLLLQRLYACCTLGMFLMHDGTNLAILCIQTSIKQIFIHQKLQVPSLLSDVFSLVLSGDNMVVSGGGVLS